MLDGSKCFISGAGSTQVLIVMARTGEDGARGISCRGAGRRARHPLRPQRGQDRLARAADPHHHLRRRAHPRRQPHRPGGARASSMP
ncbi:hypothetical protein P4114_02520 [Pseudomonas aeruginosa]|nr:hypothetical protein [Pseudomonas aeruginosa]